GVVDLPNRTVRALRDWDNTVTVTLPKNIGTMAAEMVFKPEDTGNRVVYIGSETISYGRLAGVLESNLGTKLKRELWDLVFLQKNLAEEPEELWVQYRKIFAKGVGVSWPKEETLNHRRGVRLTDVGAYIEERKDSFLDDLRL